ncbi:MAG: hypothetical protein NC417_02855 [Candidatus Gastranaerophilales bacterium]|nr:hypothetical protein [Candidatus Gastranaerophilales bacterium]
MAISMFSDIKTDTINNRELVGAIRKARSLTSGSYEDYDRNEKTLIPLLTRIMQLSRQENEWYVYFYAIYSRIYLASRTDDDRAVIKYAEIYYRDSALHMDRELPNYPNSEMASLNVWIYGYIMDTYMNCCEIDDAKMDTFMRQYEEAVLKYGQPFRYYEHEMNLALLYRDEAMAEHGKINFEKTEHELKSCYICTHTQFLGYYILKEMRETAEQLMLDYINKRIPKRHQWCYQYCQNGETQSLYADMLFYSLQQGKPELFHYFYEKYYLTLPRESQRGAKGRWYYGLSIYLSAISGNFDALDADCAEAQEDIDKMSSYTTTSQILTALEWHCYFVLLDKSGVHEVNIRLPESEGNTAEKNATLAVSRYLERIADENGEKFSRARAKYDYALRKSTYLECAGITE